MNAPSLSTRDKVLRTLQDLYFFEASALNKIVASVVIFVLMSIYLLQRADQPFWHDSLHYWELGGSFDANGRFSFLNYSSSLRGYLFPFLLYLIQWQAELFNLNSRILFAVYSSLFFTIFSIYVVPLFFQSVIGWKIRMWGIYAFSALLFYFWRGYFLYPLSDFPALFALLVAMGILAATLKKKIGLGAIVLVGVLAAAAMNIRPSYQLSFLAIVLMIAIGGWGSGVGHLVARFSLFMVGCCLILLPQVLINRTYFESSSPLVLAAYVDDSDIYAVQLFWGLRTQKVMGNIGDNYPSSLVVYQDPLSLKLSKLGTKEKNLQNYIEIIRKYPLDVAISYFRHTFNGIDPFYPTPFVKNVFATHSIFSSFNYLIWFVFFYYLVISNWSSLDIFRGSSLLGVALPVVLAVPTVIEVRFFLPIYILAYAVVSYGFPYHENFSLAGTRWWCLIRLVVFCVAWLLLCFTLSAATIEQLLS